MIATDLDPGLTVNYRFSTESLSKTHSPAAPAGLALPLSARDLLWEVNNSSTWIKTSFSTPSSQASSTSWLSPSRMAELEWEEDFYVPFRPKKTVRIAARMRYMGRYQPQNLDIEEYELD